MPSEKRVIGLIGIGKMGAPIGRRLLAAGYPLHVFDIDPAAMARLKPDGAVLEPSAKAVAEAAEIVLVSLPTPDVVRDVATRDDQLAGGSAVRTFIDLSTTGARVAVAVSEALNARGVATLDCPVSGGIKGATEGTLSLMASGPRDVFERVEDLLGQLGRVAFISEKPGAAQSLKLANNLMSVAAMAITAEASVFAAKAGLDAEVMFEVFNRSTGLNTATRDKFPRAVLPGTFDFGFATGLAVKDVRLALDEAEALGVPTPVGAIVRQMASIAEAKYGPDSDFSVMVRPIEEWAGVEVRATRKDEKKEGQ